MAVVFSAPDGPITKGQTQSYVWVFVSVLAISHLVLFDPHLLSIAMFQGSALHGLPDMHSLQAYRRSHI